MVSAIVLLTVARDKITPVAERLADMQGISEVHSVAGTYDLVAIIRVPDNEQLAQLVTEKIRALDGIEKSETLIAFRVYSKHDLDNIFSLGMEQ